MLRERCRQTSALSKPLEELTAHDLGKFAWKALTTWGDVEDLKHFLPRLMQLIAQDDCAPFSREVLLGKLRLAAWRDWSETERRSVDMFLHAVWRDCLNSAAGSVWQDELLCGIGRAVDDLAPYLTTWSDSKLTTAYEHLVHYIDWNLATLLKRGHLSNSFWSDAEPQMRQVIDWLSSRQTIDTLESRFAENPGADYSDALAVAIDRLSSLQQTLNAK